MIVLILYKVAGYTFVESVYSYDVAMNYNQ